MTPFSGMKRGTMVAALMVLSTGACAQRVAAPPVATVQQAPPVVAAPKAVQAAPVQAAPVKAPVAKAPAPKAPVKAAPPAPVQAAPVAKAKPPVKAAPPAAKPTPPAPKVAAAPPKPVAPKVAKPAEIAPPSVAKTAPRQTEALDSGLAASETASPKPPTAPKVAVTEAPKLGGQFQVIETASADYGSTTGDNPTPDQAPDIETLVDSDEPVAEAEPAVVATQEEEEPAYKPLSAFASLFSSADDEEEETAEAVAEPEPDLLASAVAEAEPTPQAANVLDPADTEATENPYPGAFADDQAYETAQISQPSFGYQAPQPQVPAYNPNAPVTIAILTPDSDSRPSISALAKGLSQAAALSARELGNRQMVLRGYDTGGNPAKAQQAAQQAVADGAQIIIGPLFSTSAAAVGPVAQAAGIPVIAFTTDESVLRRGVYSVGYLPNAEVDRMLSYAAQRGIRKIGLMSPDTPYGGIVYRTAQNTAPGYGVNIATVQPIGSDFAAASQSAERFAEFYEASPDTQGILIATNGKPLQAIAAYLAYNDVLPSKVRYMGLGTWDDPETFREATLRGGWFPGLDPALKEEFERRYSAAYSSKPPAIAALAYDGIKIVGALLQRSQSTGQPPFTIQNIENPTGFRGMSGLFRFLPSGANQRLLSILKVGRRQFEVVDPAPTTFSRRITSITGYSQ